MNRIQHPPAPPKEIAAKSPFCIESALFTPPASDSTHALFAPLHYEPNYAYPLIVWLHGSDDDEGQLVRIMPVVSLRNYVAVAPRGFPTGGPGQSDCGGFGWRQTPDEIHGAEQRILDSIEAAREKMNIADHRVFLAGFDGGGTMAFRVAMSYPHHFAGVLSFGGAFPCGHNPFSHLTEARRLQVFLAVGRDSLRYPAAVVCDDLRLLHTAGMSVTLRQYPCGHELSLQMLRDMDRWIIEQITHQSNVH
jgi:phospholipase/carboxylesterase